MAQNIINQNLDQYGLQYGEGLNPYAPDVQIDNMPTNRGYTNFDDQEVGIINTDIGNQMADVSRNQLNQLNRLGAGSGMSLNEIKEMSPPGAFDSVTPQEFQQIQDGTFNKDNLVSSIGSGLENFFFPSAGAAEINPNNTFTSSVANSPYEMDYIPPDRYRDFKPRVGTPQTMEQASMLQKGKDFFNQGKDLASSGILKAGKTGMNLFNLVKNNNPLGFLTSGIGNLFGGLDQFDTLSPADQQFILSQQDSVGNNKDPFGINIRSGFGNYADYVRNKGRFAKGNRGDYYKSLIPGLELAESETRQRDINKAIALEEEMARREEDRIRSQSPTGSMNYGSSGYEGMSDAASQQEMDQGGRGSRG
jgi:hypothetical protein